MKFAQDYKYRHIPFCSRCAAHTKFTPVQNNRVVGAMTFDNPNSNIDPTLVATRTETKLVCNTCGSEMFKWSEKESETVGYFKQFLTTSEDINSNSGCGCLIMLVNLYPLSISVFSFFSLFSQGGIRIFKEGGGIADFWVTLLIAIVSLTIFVYIQIWAKNFCSASTNTKIVTVGKGMNGETVLFNQATGEIEYK